jgi:hypothetical protein
VGPGDRPAGKNGLLSGSFQAFKHRCAGMLMVLEGARGALQHRNALADGLEL